MKKKGFTLVEVIISLVLIILIGTISIISLRKENNNTIDKSKEELETAVDVTADKLKSDNSLKQYVASETNGGTQNVISYFCFTRETLLKQGLITEENETIKNLKPNEYIKVYQDEIGTYVFEHPVTEEECSYLKSEINNDNLENTEAKIIDNLGAEENGYYLSQQITQKDDAENTYEFKIDFKFNAGKLSNVSFRPDVYTIFIVDGSASMKTSSVNRFIDARNAAISLSEKLTETNINSVSKNYVAAICFSGLWNDLNRNPIDSQTSFLTRKLVNSDFKYGDGSTFYYAAFQAALNKLNTVKDNKVKKRFFVIFLTDGDNFTNGYHDDYNPELTALKKFLNDGTTEYGKLITVGFDYNNSTLINIASSNCKGEGTNCYYQANSSASTDSSNNILNVFEGFLEVIKREVMCSTYKKAKISINLSNNFSFSDGTNNKTIEEKLDCNEEDLTSNLQTQTLIDNALYDLTFLEPDEDTLTIGTHEFSIIENISIKFYNADNNEISEILLNEEEFPTITLDIDKIEIIN